MGGGTPALPAGFEPCCWVEAISSSLRVMTLHHFWHILLPPFTWVAVAAAAGVAAACLPACLHFSPACFRRASLISTQRERHDEIWALHSVIAAGGEEMGDARFTFPPP